MAKEHNMDWNDWNDVLDSLIEMSGRISFLPTNSSIQSSKYDNRYKIKTEKHWDRLSLGQNVQAAVKRVLYSTVPQKMYWDTFTKPGPTGKPFYANYDEIIAVRKYNGWFLTLFVNEGGVVEWQTMGGYIFKWIERLIKPFVDYLQRIVTRELGKKQDNSDYTPLIDIDSCFKFEFCVRDLKTGAERLEDMGLISPTSVEYFLVVTDFFYGYSNEMDQELANYLSTEKHLGTVNKLKDINTNEWRQFFVKHNDNVLSRIKAAETVLDLESRGVEETNKFLSVTVEFATVFDTKFKRLDGGYENPIPSLLQFISQQNIEGYVLHCSKKNPDRVQNLYNVFKLKLECFGGLGFFLHRAENIRLDPVTAHISSSLENGNRMTDPPAGRHFVVQLLTVECLGGTNIPAYGGVGYWDPRTSKYLVTDRVIFKGVFKSKWGQNFFVSVPKTNSIEDMKTKKLSEIIADLDSYKRLKFAFEKHDNNFLLCENNGAETTIDDSPVFKKHPTLTRFGRSISNFIAFCIENYDPDHQTELRDVSNLEFTTTYGSKSSPCFLNVSKLNLKVGGSANGVYKSPSNNFHLMAAVIKCVGIELKTRLRKDIDYAYFKRFLDMSRSINLFIPDEIKSWTKENWNDFTSMEKLNANKTLVVNSNGSLVEPMVINESNSIFARITDYETPPAQHQAGLQQMKNLNVYFWDCFVTNFKTSKKIKYQMTKELLPYFRHTKSSSIDSADVMQMIQNEIRVLNFLPRSLGKNDQDKLKIMDYEIGHVTGGKSKNSHHLLKYKVYNALDGWPVDNEDILHCPDIIFVPKQVWNCRCSTEGTRFSVLDDSGNCTRGTGAEEFETLIRKFKRRFILVHETFISKRMFTSFENIYEYIEAYPTSVLDSESQTFEFDARLKSEEIIRFLDERIKKRSEKIDQLSFEAHQKEIQQYTKNIVTRWLKEKPRILEQLHKIATSYGFKVDPIDNLDEHEIPEKSKKRKTMETDQRKTMEPSATGLRKTIEPSAIEPKYAIHFSVKSYTPDEEVPSKPFEHKTVFFEGNAPEKTVKLAEQISGILGLTKIDTRADINVLYGFLPNPSGPYVLLEYLYAIRMLSMAYTKKRNGVDHFKNIQEKIQNFPNEINPNNYMVHVDPSSNVMTWKDKEITASNYNDVTMTARGPLVREIHELLQIKPPPPTFLQNRQFLEFFREIMKGYSDYLKLMMDAALKWNRDSFGNNTASDIDMRKLYLVPDKIEKLYNLQLTLQPNGLALYYDPTRKFKFSEHNPVLTRYEFYFAVSLETKLYVESGAYEEEYKGGNKMAKFAHYRIVFVDKLEEIQNIGRVGYNFCKRLDDQSYRRDLQPDFPPIIVATIPEPYVFSNIGNPLTENDVRMHTFPLIHKSFFEKLALETAQASLAHPAPKELIIDERFFTFRIHCFTAHGTTPDFAFRCEVDNYYYDVRTNEQALKFFQSAEEKQYDPHKCMKKINMEPDEGILCFNNTALPVVMI